MIFMTDQWSKIDYNELSTCLWYNWRVFPSSRLTKVGYNTRGIFRWINKYTKGKKSTLKNKKKKHSNSHLNIVYGNVIIIIFFFRYFNQFII